MEVDILNEYSIIISVSENHHSVISNYLKGLLGYSIEIKEENSILLISHSYLEFSDISEGLNALEQELFSGMKVVYLTKKISNQTLKLIIDNMELLPKGIYTLTEFLNAQVIIKNKSVWKEAILGPYANDTKMLEVIKVFLEANMNVSLAAKRLYLHRNTLINKLDRFELITGYDIKDFKSAWLIYSLL